jgi:SAM-dependent methyltransferase
MSRFTCPACGGADVATFYEVAGVPVNSCLLFDDTSTAQAYSRGDLQIAACHDCGFIANVAFDPAMTTYDETYEESQGFSARFQMYAKSLAATWVNRYDLSGSTVIEIGCGKGEFLSDLVRAGVGHGVGIDPGTQVSRIDADVRNRTTWVRGLFPDDHPRLDADAIVCRHTLEHIAPVGAWLRDVRTAIGNRLDTVVLFEVPDTFRILDEGAFWDIYYEHCSYFTAGSLHRLFARAGFEVLDLRKTFDDQYLVVEARPAGGRLDDALGPDDIADTLAATKRFITAQHELIDHWRDRIRAAAAGRGTVVWGASSKAVAFLAALGDENRHVRAAVDINPHKHCKFLPGTGHEIVDPKHLLDLDPELVVAMNPIYVSEIRAELTTLGLTPAVEAL